MKTCPLCNRQFTPRRKSVLYCSGQCRRDAGKLNAKSKRPLAPTRRDPFNWDKAKLTP